MRPELPACVLLLNLLSGVRPRTFLFVNLEGHLNFSQSSEQCAKIIHNDEKSGLAKSELWTLTQCSNQLEVNGVYWMNFETGMAYHEEPSAWHCTFENEKPCFFEDKKPGDFRWTRKQWYTPSVRTGPTQAYQGSYYIYMEATNVPNGQIFVLGSSILPDSEMCLLFHYHMFGSNIGKLMIIVSSDVNVTLWDQEGPTETREWYSQSVNIMPNNKESMISIIAVRGNGDKGDIALDYIRLKYGRCEMYQQLQDTVCGDIIYSESGMILSDNYPDSYRANSDCMWKIIVPYGKYVNLHINDLQLEEKILGDGCYDSLEIYDDLKGQKLAGGCRLRHFNASYRTFSRSLTLQFVSDESRAKRGFNITWTTVTDSCPAVNVSNGEISPVMTPCDEELQRVICFSDPIQDPVPVCRLYPSETTLADKTSDRQHQTSDPAMTNVTRVTDGDSRNQKPLPANSTVIAAVIGILVGIAVVVALIVSVVCFRRRRRTFNDKLHKSTVLNPEYSYQSSHYVIQNVTNQENSYVILEKEHTERENEVTRGTTKQSVNGTYENTIFDKDVAYNHLNEAVAEKGPNTYSRCNDLNSYDHLSPGIREIAESDSYDHAVKDDSICLESMGKSAKNESDYINTVVLKNNGDTIYELAHGIEKL